MITDTRQVEFFKAIASQQYVPMVLSDYGIDKREKLVSLTDGISFIYRHLAYSSFKSVTIYTALHEDSQLSIVCSSNFQIVRSYENLSPIKGEYIVIELRPNGDLHVCLDFALDINKIRENAIVYHFLKASESETIFGKTTEMLLKPIPGADSYFAVQTYKDLDVALEEYSTKVARKSECPYLKDVWCTPNKIFFKPRPEHTLRDSLTQFLKWRLRNAEVRPEQIVDKTHPVDIKVTWSLASHLALIEIKWLGKSSPGAGRRFKQQYHRQRALDGAKQLAEYLDANIRQAPVKTTRGYLVLFDGRRRGCNKDTTAVSRSNGLWYQNETIIYNPEYHSLRTDFAMPFKFFLEPEMTG